MTSARLSNRSLEPEIRRIGRHIFELAEAAGPSPLSVEYWQQKAMNWLTGNDELKLRLFRFVEVLPSLQSNAAIARHLSEYLGGADGDPYSPPDPLHLAVAFSRPDTMYASIVASAAKFGCGIGAKQFIAGDTPQQAIRTVKKLRAGGNTFTLDVLGETIIADRVARHHHQLYLDLIHHVSRDARSWPDIPMIDVAPWGALPKVNISIKLSAIVVAFDSVNPEGSSEAILERLRPLLRAARDNGAFVNVDMEHYAVKDLTLDIFRRVLTEPEFRDWPDCGIVIQCYMPEGDPDMAELIQWARRRETPITVRLVKGAYWDSETAMAERNGWPSPLYKEKWESDAAYERVGRLMLENCDIVRPAFASHNVRTISAVLATEAALGLPPRTLELQMLTGMGEPLRRALTRMKQRVRVYAPSGDMLTGMAYLTRRLIENTANESFLRQSFGGDTPVDELLRTPGLARKKNGATRSTSAAIAVAGFDRFAREPEINLAEPQERKLLLDALRRVRAKFDERYAPIINNEPVEAKAWRPSRNPGSPNEVVGEVAECDTKTIDAAVAAARRAASAWAKTPNADRAAILDRAADALHDARFDLMAWTIFETGKTWRDAAAEYLATVDYLRHFAHEWRRMSHRQRRTNGDDTIAEFAGAPRGVCAVLAPFCFPTSSIAGMAAAALVSGNTVVVKPAPHCSVCAARLCRVLIDAGLPAGVLNFVTGADDAISDALVNHADVDVIAFAGSAAAGEAILRQTRNQSTHVVAEMGGGNAIVVDDDADIDNAVQATIAGAFGFSGQKYSACSRAIVLGNIYDAFLEKLREAADGIQPRQADDPAAIVGPLIDDNALDHYDAMIAEARRRGRLILPGGRCDSDSDGHFARPAIVADIAPDSPIARREIVAPILVVLKAKTFDEAIRIANDTPRPLVAGVYSRSPTHIAQAKRRLNVGTLYVNRKMTLRSVDRREIGGDSNGGFDGANGHDATERGQSMGGAAYLRAFCRIGKSASHATRLDHAHSNAEAAHAGGAK